MGDCDGVGLGLVHPLAADCGARAGNAGDYLVECDDLARSSLHRGCRKAHIMNDYDSPKTIIEAVREWQEASSVECPCVGTTEEGIYCWVKEEVTRTKDAVLALRLPPKGEGR